MRQVYEHCLPEDSEKLDIREVDKNPTFKDRVHCITITNDEVIRVSLKQELAKYGYKGNNIISGEGDWDALKKECDDLSEYFN